MTEDYVFDRLGIKGLGEEVLAQLPLESTSNVEEELACDSNVLATVSDGSQPSASSETSGWHWALVKLSKLSLPTASVELMVGKEVSTFIVCVDDLRPKIKEKPEPKTNLHPSLVYGDALLDAYDCDFCETSVKEAIANYLLAWAHAGLRCRCAKRHIKVEPRLEDVEEAHAELLSLGF